jgi:hypothetical protein
VPRQHSRAKEGDHRLTGTLEGQHAEEGGRSRRLETWTIYGCMLDIATEVYQMRSVYAGSITVPCDHAHTVRCSCV